LSVAESRLADLKTHREARNAQAQASSAKLTYGTAADIYRQRRADNPKIKSRTRAHYGEILASLKEGWPSLNEMETLKVTPTQCRD
jgi:hypothetical protein